MSAPSGVAYLRAAGVLVERRCARCGLRHLALSWSPPYAPCLLCVWCGAR